MKFSTKSLLRCLGFIGIFALAGATVPFIISIASHQLYNGHQKYLIPSLYGTDFFWKATLVLWPSSIVELFAAPPGELLPESPGNENAMFEVALVVNVLLYTVVGFFVWLGINKHKVFFAVPILMLAPIWWWLLASHQ